MPLLNIAVIGAGPGGLTSALALQKAGHKVDIFERSSFTKARGFRLALGPNALRCLDGVGVTWEAMGARPLKSEIFHHGENLEWFKTEDFEYVLPRYGYDWAMVDRDDLQRAMVKQAGLTPEGMEKISIHLSSEVAEVSVEKREIQLTNREAWKGDMIVIANGVNSKQVGQLEDGQIPPLQYGRTAYRVHVPVEEMKKDDEIWNKWKDHEKDIITFGVWDKSSLFMTMAYSDIEWGGLLMSPSMKAVDGSDADYDLHVAPDAAGKYVGDFDPMIQRWVKMSTHTTVWTTVYRESLSRMARGCAVGIGDAVHPHLPHHGQGATSAIEDGASLAPFLDASDISLTPESLTDRLEAWEKLRMPRARMVHMLSIRWPAPLNEIKPEIRRIYDGPLPEHNKDHTEVMWDFLFGYDVVAEAKRAAKDMAGAGE